MNYRPSSLPGLEACPCYEPDQTSDVEQKQAGTLRHEALAAYLSGTEGWDANLDEHDAEGVAWAGEYIRCHAPMSEHPLQIEEKRTALTDSWEEITGTPDVTCGFALFDLKGRSIDTYAPQMAAYALMTGFAVVNVHVLYATEKKAKTWRIGRAAAMEVVERIIAKASDPNRQPTACDWCGWCSKRLTCPSVLKGVNAVVAARDDWYLDTYHSTEIETAEQMGKALTIARRLNEWCEAVEHHAREMVTKKGMVPTGFEVKTRRGSREIASVADAFGLAGLPQEAFLKACQVKFSKLVEVTAEFHGMKKAQAERDLDTKLASVIERKPSTQFLQAL